nr:unnamed protein product [Callosobruchus analis]
MFLLKRVQALKQLSPPPSAPARKGKRNIERFPFAIIERYQEMYRKARVKGRAGERERKQKKETNGNTK